VASYLDIDDAALMVVGAGEDDGDLDDAVRAIEDALHDSRDVRLVMDAKAIGRVEDLGDSEIVKRTAAFPIDYVVLVRVFPESGGGATAVVTIYDKHGDTDSAFSVSRGDELRRRSGRERSTSSGVSRDAVDAVTATFDEEEDRRYDDDDRRYDDDDRRYDDDDRRYDDDDRRYDDDEFDDHVNVKIDRDIDDPVEYFERHCLWYQAYVGISSSSGEVVTSGTNLYLGKYKKSVSGGDIYEIIGRRDLLAQYRKNDKKRGILALIGFGGGGFFLALGAAVAVTGAEGRLGDPDFGTIDPDKDTIALGGVLMATGGIAMGIIGTASAASPLHPVDEVQTRQLVDSYNKTLRKKLGLPEPRSSELVPPAPRRTGLQLAVSFGPGAFSIYGQF